VDVDTSGNVVIGGKCEDSTLCGAKAPNPIIEYLKSSTLKIEWSKYIDD
jgi:hypothetical protein